MKQPTKTQAPTIQTKLPKGQGLSSGQLSKRAQVMMGSYGLASTITLIGDHANKNPKRGESAKRFALYRNGITVQEYMDAVVGLGFPKRTAWLDLAWDVHHKFIALEARADAQAAA